jgi:hypothetical protein
MRLIPLVLAMIACGGPQGEGKPNDTNTPEVNDDTGGPSLVFVDEDRDGHLADVDCDDNDYQVYPGAPELCDAKDNDCNDEVDEGFDVDGDGAFPIGTCSHGTDCDDADPSVPTDEIAYDGLDQDCDGSDLNDIDGDGYVGQEGGGSDCNDDDATIHPGADEVSKDGIDQDCNGLDHLDGDRDGYDDAAAGGEDCDDDQPSVHPGAVDWMNDGVDSDCDGEDNSLAQIDDATVHISGDSGAYDLAGRGIAVCDLDSDEIPDLVVTAPYAGGYHGMVGVFYGRYAHEWGGTMQLADADTLITSAAPVVGFDAACTDLDGDGVDDVIISRGEIEFGAWSSDFALMVFYGVGGMLPGDLDEIDADAVLGYELGVVPGEGSTTAPSFIAGDLTGDGASELIIAMQAGDTSFGQSAVFVLPGGSYSGTQDISDVASAVISDDQGDTVTSLAVTQGETGAQLFIGQGLYRDGLSVDAGAAMSGRASWLNLGGSDGSSIEDAAQASFVGTGSMAVGWSGVFGDLDGDGTQDAIISAPLTDTPTSGGGGVALLWDHASHLSSTGMDLSATADGTIIGSQDDGYLGYTVGLMGDLDGDGMGEILLTEPGAGGGLGTVWVVSAGALTAGPDSVEDVGLLGIQGQYTTANTGGALASADFDGDGLGDIVISSDLHPTPGTVGLVPTGRVSIFLSASLAD